VTKDSNVCPGTCQYQQTVSLLKNVVITHPRVASTLHQSAARCLPGCGARIFSGIAMLGGVRAVAFAWAQMV